MTAAQRRRLARAFEDAGQVDEATTLLTDMLAQDRSDVASVAQVARIFVQQGHAEAAGEYLTADMAGDDPEARLAIAEILCRGGKYDAGLELLERTVADNPDSIEPAGTLAAVIASRAPEHGELAIRLVANSLCAQSRWSDAATALERFITEKPDCIEAIVQLVEVAVDGHLAETAERAQARLANAYLANGSAAEAIAILEDLASRHPEQPMYATQLRQALVMAGETNPDTALEQRLTAAALTSGGKVTHSSKSADHANTVVPFRAVV
jgi:predicted Zn-dependent protease